jgi:ParB family chromosome partitioning protein
MSRDIPIDAIDPSPDQPRKRLDERSIRELANSMQSSRQGMPIQVRPAGARFFLVCGARRLQAARLLGWKTIRAEVLYLAAAEARWLTLVENIQRENLTPIEEAEAYRRLLGEGVTQQELGRRIGKTQSYLATKLRLLKLPGEVQEAIAAGTLTERHAKQLLRLGDVDAAGRLFRRTIEHGLTVRSLTDAVTQELTYLEARQQAGRLGDLASGLERLAACGCAPPVSNYWPAEDFTHCPDRLTGIFARFLYLFHPRLAYAHNFTDAGDLSFLEALQLMRVGRAGEPGRADLVFVRLPGDSPDRAQEALAFALRYAKAKPEMSFVFRTGTERVGENEFRQRLELNRLLSDQRFHVAYPFVCTLCELPLSRQQLDALPPWDKRTCIGVFEEWIPASMSRNLFDIYPTEELSPTPQPTLTLQAVGR